MAHVPKASTDDAVLQQQYLRALDTFESIVLSQIELKNKLSDRLNYSIRTGVTILGVIAFSILVLLLTLTSQIDRMSKSVSDMNTHFSSVSQHMTQISDDMIAIERQVALLIPIDQKMATFETEIGSMQLVLDMMEGDVEGIAHHTGVVRHSVGNIALTIDRMNRDVQVISHSMHRIAGPARTMNKMLPFP